MCQDKARVGSGNMNYTYVLFGLRRVDKDRVYDFVPEVRCLYRAVADEKSLVVQIGALV